MLSFIELIKKRIRKHQEIVRLGFPCLFFRDTRKFSVISIPHTLTNHMGFRASI